MIDIDFTKNNESVLINLKVDSAENIIFYVLDVKTKDKIFIRYLDGTMVFLEKALIEDRDVKFQFYFNDIRSGKKENVITDIISYRKVNFSYYQLIVGGQDYKILKKEGYYSVDRLLKVDLNKPIIWQTNHRNFDFNINSLRFLSSYWARFLKTFERNVFYEIYGFIKQYYDHMCKETKFRSPFIQYDMAIGIRSLHISFAYQLKDLLNVQESEIIEWLWEEHLKLSTNPKIFTLSNHGLWLIYGLRVLLKVKNDCKPDELEYCLAQFEKLINANFNEEYVGTENSPFYHQYNIDLYKRIPRSLFLDNKKFEEVITKGAAITPWFLDQLGNYYQIGDTEGGYKVGFSPEYYSDSKMVLGRKTILSKCFNDSGYFIAKILNSDNQVENEFVFYNTSDSYVHKHLDGNSFIYFYKGKEVFSDAGKYTYDHNELREYFTSHYGHNTVTLASTDFDIKDLELKKTGFRKFSEQDDRFEIRSEVVYKQFSHIRDITFKKDGDIEMLDQIQNRTGSNIILNFLFSRDITPKLKDGEIFLYDKNNLIAKLSSDIDAIDILILKGQESPYRGWISKKYQTLDATFSLELRFPAGTKEVRTMISFLE